MKALEYIFQIRREPVALNKSILLAVVCVLFVCTSCSVETSKRAGHYSIDSLMRAQIKILTGANASIKKVAMLGNQEAKTSFSPTDTIAWIKELDIFSNLDIINKPVNRDAYTVEDGIKDSKSNLKLKIFRSKAELPVEYLKIYYQNKIANVRRIESKYNEANSMYAGTRYLIMEFEEIKNRPILTYYSVYGGQKMFLGDSVAYTINASISIPD